jgi:NIMA (never in mitosis gene a)-related kinase
MESKQSGLKDFDVLGKLGEGAFGQVFKVRRREDGKEYALKKVRLM